MPSELLDWAESRARASDPETSHEGAKHVAKNLTGLHFTFLRVLGELKQATANEVAAAASDNFARRNTIRRRASDLVEAGKIRAAGKRVCSVSNRAAQIYEVIE